MEDENIENLLGHQKEFLKTAPPPPSNTGFCASAVVSRFFSGFFAYTAKTFGLITKKVKKGKEPNVKEISVLKVLIIRFYYTKETNIQ